MHYGIIPGYGVAPVETGEYATGLARLAEELDFESIWPVEHVVMPTKYAHVYPYDASGRMPIEDAAVPDPLTWLGWVAAVTTRLKLGTAILILPQRNPLVAAKTVASLDRLSNGRVLLGIGVGWLREEAEALGTNFQNRGRRTDEYIQAMRALWSEPVASFEGEHVRFQEVKCNPRPAQTNGVPIHVGGQTPAAARRAGRLGQGFIPMGESLEAIAELRETMAQAAREASRDPDAIEISCLGPPQPDLAKAYADAGVTRMIVASREPDLESVRRVMGAFRESVRGIG